QRKSAAYSTPFSTVHKKTPHGKQKRATSGFSAKMTDSPKIMVTIHKEILWFAKILYHKITNLSTAFL
ncbi:MAG: hypothetical protein IKC69_06080, partial [Clostridia bacterium]|nr:hypothetical protein [Clostridia bacterium]